MKFKPAMLIGLVLAFLAYWYWEARNFSNAAFKKDPNRWDELRRHLGNYKTRYELDDQAREVMENDLWVSAAQRLGTSGDASARAYGTAQAFFKGIDVAPSGWELNINLPLQDEFLAFAQANKASVTEKSVATGSLL